MPPCTFASPKKRWPMKHKDLDATSTKNVAKKSWAQETSIEASIHADTAGTDAPRHPVWSKAGIGVHIQVAPPPYTSVPDTSEPCSIVEPLQPLGFSLRQQGARFGFTDNSLIVPPEPNLNHPYDAVSRNIPKKFAKNTGIGHTAAHSVAPPTTGFLEWNLDPVLHDAKTGMVEFQSTGVHSSTDEEDGEDNEDKEDNEDDEDNENENEDNGDDPDNEDEQNAGPEGEMRKQEISWGEDFPGKSPLCIPTSLQVIILCLILTLHSPTMRMTWQPKRALVGWLTPQGNLEWSLEIEIPQTSSSTMLPRAFWIACEEGNSYKMLRIRKVNNSRLLYNDLTTWQSDLKKSVMSIAPVQYSLIPLPLVPTQLHAEWIEKATAALLANSLFLHHGVDSMFNCILNGLRKYYPKFTTKEYGPIYHKMLQLLKDILKYHYHSPILLAQLQEWAQVGWAESSKIDGTIESRHNHLQIILD
ncbi:hypothetical protein BDR06DRAFT_973419 [Suillus hirtellus]|nr:hypothetical protein BDR06DRAFT_973419 [Suillus hirtellus]